MSWDFRTLTRSHIQIAIESGNEIDLWSEAKTIIELAASGKELGYKTVSDAEIKNAIEAYVYISVNEGGGGWWERVSTAE